MGCTAPAAIVLNAIHGSGRFSNHSASAFGSRHQLLSFQPFFWAPGSPSPWSCGVFCALQYPPGWNVFIQKSGMRSCSTQNFSVLNACAPMPTGTPSLRISFSARSMIFQLPSTAHLSAPNPWM